MDDDETEDVELDEVELDTEWQDDEHAVTLDDAALEIGEAILSEHGTRWV